MDTSAKVNRARLPKVAQPISEHQSLRRVFDPTPISCTNSYSSFIRQPSLVYKWPLARICCVPAIQHTQRRYAAISCGAPIQRDSRPLPLITAILSGCFRASAYAARRTEPVCARVGGKEL